MTRITDANLFFEGQEPKFAGEEITKGKLIETLNWYSRNKTYKDSKSYVIEYFKKSLKVKLCEDAVKNISPTFGFVCRILTNGGILSDKDTIWFEKEKSQIRKNTTVQIDEQPIVNAQPVSTIQERIIDKSNNCIAELEGSIDDLFKSKFKSNIQPYAVMYNMNIKDAQTKHILEWAKNKRKEFDEVLTTNNKDVKEGWSNISKPELKKLISFCDQVILDCQKISGESIKTRKPRKRKQKTPEQLVSKVKICNEFAELNLKSVEIKSIVGASQLWVYNTKYRKLGVYNSLDAGGFSIKGTTLQNFNETKSVQKKLRKPEESLPKLLSAGKVLLRNFMSEIRAVESPLTGRLNEETVLLKVIK
jgi:hypothetical protein